MGKCEFCGLEHKPCDLENCYCGEETPTLNGEGYNLKCTEFWLNRED
jgi:hypothetical protein